MELLSPKMEMAVAASTMLRKSGEIVVTSGGILVVTWLALALFPVYVRVCELCALCVCGRKRDGKQAAWPEQVKRRFNTMA